MKHLTRLLILSVQFFLFASWPCLAQFDEPRPNAGDPSLPDWVKLMYADQPNMRSVDSAYEAYYRVHPFEKTIYTQYYKRWKTAFQPYVLPDGTVKKLTALESVKMGKSRRDAQQSTRQFNPWTPTGPFVHIPTRYNAGDPQPQVSWHANVYSIDRCLSNPDVLYAGTESGGVYKTTDGGQQWTFVTPNEGVTAIRALAVHPANPDIAYFANGSGILRTTDGGNSWSLTGQPIFQGTTIYADDIFINPANPNMIFLGTSQGLFRSVDGGDNYDEILPEKCVSVLSQPDNPAVIYALQYDPVVKIAYFYKSLDSGLTFTIKPNGWFEVPPADAGLIESYGGRLAVTEANPDKVYALLVGNSQAAANLQLNGFIGIYVSNDAGENWQNPHGQIGAPYNGTSHPNPMTFYGDNNPYNQIYYNTTIIASQLDENQLLFGGLSLWRSSDGGATMSSVGGYVGNVPYIHPDMQTLRIYRTGPASEEIWIACDGGVNYSTDFVNTHESRTRGIVASEYWGFDQGWNDDILVGGRYHNGNSARNDNYSPGLSITVGGGEASTGYVNYSPEQKAYYSDIGGRVVPETEGDLIQGFPCTLFPNEGYWANESSRIVFDLDCWNTSYLGFQNGFYRSDDGGGQFTQVHQFPGLTSDKTLWIEQSWADPKVIYLQQVIGGVSQLWRSNDKGQNWSQVNIPLSNLRYLYFTLSETDPDELWLGYGDGPNGQKIYHTSDGGNNWDNLSTPALDWQTIASIAHQSGTDGGVYIAMFWGQVYYRKNSLPDWTPYNTGLPVAAQPLRIVPFYRDNKLRMATRGHGIWESSLYEPSQPVAEFGADRLSFDCQNNVIRFTAHAVASGTATYAWSFPGGTPATSTDINPTVSYGASGNFDVQLIVFDQGTSDTLIKTGFITSNIQSMAIPVAEGFEGVVLPGWQAVQNQGSSYDWSVTNLAGGYGASANSIYLDNYSFDVSNNIDEFRTSPLDLSGLTSVELRFDVAYAEYAPQYSDSLEVQVSTDCGTTRTLVYLKGGADLATAPPNGLSTFIPTASQWRTEVIDLSAFAGQPNLMIILGNRGHYGQAIYVDNINIDDQTTTGVKPVQGLPFFMQPNPASEVVQIGIPNIEGEKALLRVFDMTGKLVHENSLQGSTKMFTYSLDIREFPQGVYQLVVSAGQRSESKRLAISR